tara:strand:- start:365 stop:508 length:144 start_codon:yes stop_codon:yes gene_type:complete
MICAQPASTSHAPVSLQVDRDVKGDMGKKEHAHVAQLKSTERLGIVK